MRGVFIVLGCTVAGALLGLVKGSHEVWGGDKAPKKPKDGFDAFVGAIGLGLSLGYVAFTMLLWSGVGLGVGAVAGVISELI